MADAILADLNASGIYQIRNLVNGKRYIGSAVHIARRWRQHLHDLRRGNHNPIMLNAWRKYGEGAFVFEVIERVADPSDLVSREQYYIDTAKPEYNCARVAGSNFGVRFGPESLARRAKASKATWERPGHRQKMSDAHKGYSPTAEHRKKISEANKGRKLSPGHAANVAENNRRRNKTPEHRKRMSDFWRGRKKSAEQISKMAESKRGVVLTEEHKRKVSEGLKRAFQEGRRTRVLSEQSRARIGRKIAKLSDDQVREIRALMASGVKRKDLAERFGVKGTAISNIHTRSTYNWVE
jgi:group I intron endonuclease